MIRFLLTIKFVVLVPLMGFAQWKSQIGLNFVPLIARSVEVTSEFSNHPAYSLNLNAGYTFGTGRESFADYDVYDGVNDRKTSGAFAKAGGRVYLRSLKGQHPEPISLSAQVLFFLSTNKPRLKRRFQQIWILILSRPVPKGQL